MKSKLKIILLTAVLLSICTLIADPADIEEGGTITGEITPEQQAQLAYANIYNPKDPAYFSWNWGDYKTIPDWSKLTDDQWKKIPQNRVKEIPADQLDYSKLSAEQRKGMAAEQIAVNFDKIDNLAKDVDVKEAEKAIQAKYDVEVKLGEGAQLKNGILSATYGEKGQVTLTGSNYKLGQLKMNEGGRIIFTLSPQQTEILIPDTDIVVVDTQERTLSYLGNEVKGTLNFEKGQTYLEFRPDLLTEKVAEIKVAEINGVQVNSFRNWARGRINLFFDGKKHPGSYLSFDPTGKKMRYGNEPHEGYEGITTYYYEIQFSPGNPFFDIEKRDYLRMDFPMRTDVVIEQRTGKIPLVTIQVNPSSARPTFRNGINTVVLSSGAGYEFQINSVALSAQAGDENLIANAQFKQDSVPFTLLIQDEKGNNILGRPSFNYEDTGIRNKVVFDEGGSFRVVPENIPEEEYEKIGSSVIYNQDQVQLVRTMLDQYQWPVRENLLEYLGDIVDLEKLDLPRLDPALLRKLIKDLEELTPKQRASIKELQIVQGYAGDLCWSSKAVGCANPLNNKIIINENQLGEGTLYHEAAHTADFDEKRNAEVASFKKLVRFQKGLDQSDKSIEEQQEIDVYLSREERWDKAFNSVLGKDLGPKGKLGFGSASTWADGSTEPRKGCVTPYACNNIWELKAETAELAHRADSYTFFKPLIDPFSDKYDPRYREALDLTYEAGKISKSEYDYIINYKEEEEKQVATK
ncbi:MAG: hypothetical protein AABW48_04965 [Nanoarchaeota archaeon]